MHDETYQRAQQFYGVEHWSAGYFEIATNGHLRVHPAAGDPRHADLFEIVQSLVETQNIPPLLLRFPPNSHRTTPKTVTGLPDCNRPFPIWWQALPGLPHEGEPTPRGASKSSCDSARCRVGLECGSKAELYAALAQDQTPESLLICNGYKDETFIELATLGTQVGKRVVVVVEKLNELKMILRQYEKTGVAPLIGLRAKLYSRSGKWAASGGEAAKFGLTTSEILECVRLLRDAKLDSATDPDALSHRLTDHRHQTRQKRHEGSGPRLYSKLHCSASASSLWTSAAVSA